MRLLNPDGTRMDFDIPEAGEVDEPRDEVEAAIETYWSESRQTFGAGDLQADVFELIENIDARY